ncbi:MAG TPA: IMP dehydrogenase [Oligoflexia bacterium]|nr:IMP dehydrogenase [Oligoflexia bacterium]HMR25799.1 IMP dehydrogenase [Oligoflexia bacterium]
MANSSTEIQTALSFDDVLLLPQESAVLPRNVELKTQLTKTIKLNTPIISAAMDTVTEAQLAIRMAQEGALGVVHRNMTIERQAAEVKKVKKSESGMVKDPITMQPNETVQKALNIMLEHKISGIPVTVGKELKGIVTNRDLQFESNMQLTVSEVMTKKLVTAQEGVSLEEAKALLHQHRIEKLLVVDKKQELKGLITIRDIKKASEFPHASKDKEARLLCGAAVGTGEDTLDRVTALLEAGVDVVVVDTAHGHSSGVLQKINEIRKKFNHIQIIAGNIATEQAALALIDAGVDAVKVGIGPGSICTTRIIAGIGVPQLTAIMNVAKAAKKKNIPVIADGGIKYSGDIVKALAAGASSVMIGSLLAGTKEAPGEQVLYQGRTFKTYRGMGSLGAMKGGSADRYFQDQMTAEYKLVPEGIEGRVPYKGSLSNVIHQLTGGLRAGMGYVGAKDIPNLHKRAKFVRITQSGLRESHVHDVSITKETPNYQTMS